MIHHVIKSDKCISFSTLVTYTHARQVDDIVFDDFSSVVNQPALCNKRANSVLEQFRLNSALSGTAGSTTGQSHLFFGKSTNGYI